MQIEQLYQLFKKSTGVCTDTRQITEGVIFFALKGANFNGNKFAEDALKKGASYAVIDEQEYKANERCVLVEDGLKALQDLANHHRKQFSVPFIAITGSNGKTTTKELIFTVLAARFKTYATKGNLNNHIGIPLTILAIKPDAEMAIIEMGANHQKEIEGYCKIAEPTHGIITNIGKAHLEGFGGLEGVKKGKGELFDYLLKTNGTAFINSKNEILMGMQKFPEPVLYPQKGDFYESSLLEVNPYIKLKAENGEEVQTHLIGEYNFDNIAAALAIGKYFEVPDKAANAAIATYIPQNNRSQIIKQGSNTLILDAYNANPSSMRAAIQNFSELKADKKVVILGDMFELGEESAEEHTKLVEFLTEKAFTEFLLCGKNFSNNRESNPEFNFFPDRTELEKYLQDHKIASAHILIKGSRGMGLEKIVELI